MALVSGSLPGLHDGVSQQPALVRNASQGEVQINGVSSVVNGLSKRPASEFIARLLSSAPAGTATYICELGEGGKYVVMAYTSSGTEYLKLFNATTGAEVTINNLVGNLNYIQCTTPADQLKFMSVGDFIFILNTSINPALKTGTNSPGTLKGTKQLFSDLPTSGNTIGDIWKIEGTPDSGADNYYVIFQSGNYWAECSKPGELYKLDWDTMPHVLKPDGLGAFDYAQPQWNDREVGDRGDGKTGSIPDPSFIGNPVTDIFFFRSRLGFLSKQNIILSSFGDYYNFWPSTATAVLDTDPIDVSAATNYASDLRSCIPFNKTLLLFGQTEQFILSGGKGDESFLSPKTVAIDFTTRFPTNTCRPVGAGNNAYFALDRGDYTSIREYFLDADTLMHDAADITAHVSSYIPKGLKHMTASSGEDMILGLTSGDPNALYVYRYFWGEDKKLQSSWSLWEFGQNDDILNVEILGSNIFLVVARQGGIELEKIDLTVGRTDGNLPYQVLLDRRRSLTGSYSAVTNETTWTLPQAEDSAETLEAVLGSSFGTQEGTRLTLTRVNSTTYKVTGDYSGGAAWIGRVYTFRYRFSPQFYKRESGGAVEGKLKLRQFTVYYSDTGYFRAEVTPFFQQVLYTYDYIETGLSLGTGLTILGSVSMYSGKKTFPVLADNDKVVIELVNDSPQPSVFTSATWNGTFVQKARPI